MEKQSKKMSNMSCASNCFDVFSQMLESWGDKPFAGNEIRYTRCFIR